MKKYVLFLCMSLVAIGAYSQKEIDKESKKTKTIDQQQKNELKKTEKETERKRTEEMIVNRQFVLEVNFISDQSGNLLNTAEQIGVSSSLNYIAINVNKIVLQLETNAHQTSNWPFDDFPLNGTFSQYEIQKLIKTSEGYVFRFHTDGRIGTYNFTFNVSTDGKTDLKMEANNGVSLHLRGVLVPLNKSRIKPVFI